MLKDYSKEVKTLKKDLARVKANLVKQQEKVVNPLIREVKIREEKVNKYSEYTQKLTKHVKMLAATLKLPYMTD